MIILALLSGFISIDMSTQVIISLSMIAILGIPHGAIDHILFLDDKSLKPVVFYSVYLGLIVGNIAAWTLFPAISLLFFLLVSAYHFGQSQFSDINNSIEKHNHILYLVWGISILLGLVYYNSLEITNVISQNVDLLPFETLMNESSIFSLLIFFSGATLLYLFYFCINGWMSYERMFLEIFLLAIIHLSFYLLPILIGFTLYFVVLHSLKVLNEEFDYLRSTRKDFSLKSFASLLLPYTFLSLFFGAIIIALAYFQILEVSYTLTFFVLLSAITLPHSIVMNKFYTHLL
jgi:Brp/Blh family beta-carotene 15,15'-monooxygenase